MNPWARHPSVDRHPGPFREGDRVQFNWGGPTVGVIVEDMGNLGHERRRIYRVVADLDGGISEPLSIELPAEDLTLVERAGRKSGKKGRK